MSKAIKHYGIVNKVWLKRYKKKNLEIKAESNTEQREREKKSKDESG